MVVGGDLTFGVEPSTALKSPQAGTCLLHLHVKASTALGSRGVSPRTQDLSLLCPFNLADFPLPGFKTLMGQVTFTCKQELPQRETESLS